VRRRARLVDDLRRDGDAVDALSRVAEVNGLIVGHLVCSRALIGQRPSLGLGPLGIVPDRQRTSIGAALMHAVVVAADALDAPTIVLLRTSHVLPTLRVRSSRRPRHRTSAGLGPPALHGAPPQCVVGGRARPIPLRPGIRRHVTPCDEQSVCRFAERAC